MNAGRSIRAFRNALCLSASFLLVDSSYSSIFASMECCIKSGDINTTIAHLRAVNVLLQTSFGTRCKILRDGLGLSQEAFAHHIGMDRSYYASIEVGRRNVTLANIKKIADGFDITPSELLRGVGERDGV